MNRYIQDHRQWAEADLEILNRIGALCQPPLLADKENITFQSKKAKTKLETISFWQNISIRTFTSSPVLYTMKACQ